MEFGRRAVILTGLILATGSAIAQTPTAVDARTRGQLTEDANRMAQCSGFFEFSAEMMRGNGDAAGERTYRSASLTTYEGAGVLRFMVLQSLGDTCNVEHGCDPTAKVYRYVDEWKASGKKRVVDMINDANKQGLDQYLRDCKKALDKASYMLQAKRDAEDIETGPTPTGQPRRL